MDLSAFQINPTLRGRWEAVDLGTVLARRWYRSLFLAWLVPSAIIFTVLLLLFPKMGWIASTVCWLLKPLFDRISLYLLSRYVFSEPVSALRSWRQILSILKIEWFSALTWRRFDIQRSFNLAVTVLEQQKGAARSSRCNLLQRKSGGASSWLTIVCMHIEVMLCLSFALFAFLLIPEGISIGYFDIYDEQSMALVEIVYYVLFFLASAVVAPFYIASGFSLYINRRIELEAWDVEIEFRRFVQTREEKNKDLGLNKLVKARSVKSHNGIALLLLVVLGLGSANFLEQAQADDLSENTEFEQSFENVNVGKIGVNGYENSFSDDSYILHPGSPQSEAKQDILTLLSTEPFVIEQADTQWIWKGEFEEAEPEEEDVSFEWLESFFEFLEGISGLKNLVENIALIVEVFIWGLAILLVGTILYKYRAGIRRYLSKMTSNSGIQEELFRPSVIMGMEITEESLPDDVPSEAKNLWQSGSHRQAFSLLYRASLYELVYMHHIELLESDTEQECYARVHADLQLLALVNYFAQLTKSWQAFAYAHRQPNNEEFEALRLGWAGAFKESPNEANPNTASSSVVVDKEQQPK